MSFVPASSSPTSRGWREVAEAHLAAFGEARPAATMVEVTALIDPQLLVEIEAVAYKPGVGAT